MVWLLALGQQDEKIDQEEEMIFINPVSHMPIFKGCATPSRYEEQRKCSNEEVLKFFLKKFRYPKEIRCGSFYMTIPIRWKFEKDGSISNILFLKPSHQALEKEFIRVIRLMPNWTPAIHHGEPTAVCYNFPLRIHLDYK